MNHSTPDNPDEEPQKPQFTVVDRRFWAQEDTDEAEAGKERKPSYVEQLEHQLEERTQKLDSIRQKHEHALSEFENAKARLRREVGKELHVHKRLFLADFLEVLDSLDLALQAASDPAQTTAVLEGVRMVREQFLGKLEAHGVQRGNSLNQPFDPSRHEAVSSIPVHDAAQDGLVLGIIREAYLMGDEVIRPGVVAVGKSEPHLPHG